MRAVAEHDGALDGRNPVGDFFQERQESDVGHHHAVFGVIDDPDDLLGEQPRIDGVINGADAENAVPAFQVPPGVPGQRRHPVAVVHAVAFEPLRHPQAPGADLAVIRGMDRSLDRAGNHRPLAMIDRGVIDDAMAQQRPILHQSEHDFFSRARRAWTAPAAPAKPDTTGPRLNRHDGEANSFVPPALEAAGIAGLKHSGVRRIVIMAALIGALTGAAGDAAAQDNSVPAAQPAKQPAKPSPRTGLDAERGPLRTKPQLPIVLPHQFAPPQEAYASFPEPAAAAVPVAPSACQLSLAKVAEFQSIPVLVGPGDCGAADAVQLDAIVLPDRSQVTVAPPAILRCPMAQAVTDWVRDDVAPSLRDLPPLRGLDNLASYDCRGRNDVRAAKVSEHGRADALDVRDFRLADGRKLVLTDMTVDKDWRETIRASACARFSTVLGPGADGYHEEHIHIDLEERRGNYKICEWDVRVPPAPVQAQSRQSQEPNAAAPAEGVPLQGLDVPAIPLDEVPLPRPRPVAANAAQNRSLK